MKKYFYVLISLLYFDLIFVLNAYDTYLFSSVVNIVLFALINAGFIYLITGLFNEKVNRIIMYILLIIIWFWHCFHYVFYKVLITPFSIALFRQADQTLKFGKNIVISVIQNSPIMLLMLLPVILLIIFRKKINCEKYNKKQKILSLALIVASILIFVGNIFIQNNGYGSTYNLYYENNNVSLNIERLGVMSATYLDIKRTIFGFEEKIEIVNATEMEEEPAPSVPAKVGVLYDMNTLDIDFDKGNTPIVNEFMKNEVGTKQNAYTGMFAGKNLVFIVAESFSEIAVSEEYTPTLYKLVHDGFYFENFYTSNNLSTIGGEFQALTGLYADNTILSSWRGGRAYYPYGIGTVFSNLGYSTYAYHDNSAYFQDRNVYLATQGLSNYKGCYNGLENLINCEQWPQSDIEMMNATIDDYINDETPFLAYYMTVSGHFYYTFGGNMIAAKNKDLVKDLDYPEEVKGYIATQIELDKAVEILINRLTEASKLDDTVIVLLADHYPYNLNINHINMLSDYERDSLIEANSNALIIYNPSIEQTTISKVGMSIDVLPTVLNLFGIDYDSRLIMGKDILSKTEGIAIFKDKSWVTNKGTYYAATDKFVASSDEIPEGYVDTINAIVNNRVAISRMIVENNYYKSVLK